jgi:hypothetical protein
MRMAMRGYNGNLLLANDGVTIERGFKGLLVRKRSSASHSIPRGDVREVWFQPSTGRRGLPGYVLVVGRSDSPPDDYLGRVRDARSVTFLGRSDEWRALAETVARQCSAPLREFPAETRSGREVAKQRLGDDQDTRF